MTRSKKVASRIIACLIAAMGLFKLFLGVELVVLGGSSYYVITGALEVVSGVLLWKGRLQGAWLYGATFMGTILWAFYEAGMDPWGLMPRVMLPIIIVLCLILP